MTRGKKSQKRTGGVKSLSPESLVLVRRAGKESAFGKESLGFVVWVSNDRNICIVAATRHGLINYRTIWVDPFSEGGARAHRFEIIGGPFFGEDPIVDLGFLVLRDLRPSSKLKAIRIEPDDPVLPKTKRVILSHAGFNARLCKWVVRSHRMTRELEDFCIFRHVDEYHVPVIPIQQPTSKELQERFEGVGYVRCCVRVLLGIPSRQKSSGTPVLTQAGRLVGMGWGGSDPHFRHGQMDNAYDFYGDLMQTTPTSLMHRIYHQEVWPQLNALL